MGYTVDWQPGPLTALASITVRAADRQAVTYAANKIDRLLRLVPTSIGTVSGTTRRFRVAPLEVVYSVNVNARKVIVSYLLYRP